MSRALGTYKSVYLPLPLVEHVEASARESGLSVACWIRETLIDTCPPTLRTEVRALMKTNPTDAQGKVRLGARHWSRKKAEEKPPEPVQTVEELAEHYRQAILDLDARGYSPMYIASRLKLPHAVISTALNTKAKPKKGTPK